MRREPFYCELLAPRKIGNYVGLNVAVGDQTWIASVQRASDAPPPDEALIARAKQALPALAAAARSSFMLGRKRFENWKDVIDEESRGVFLVDHLGRLIDRNAASEVFLKAAMRLRNRTLHLSDPRQDVAFQHMVAVACSARASEHEHLPPPVLWTDEDGSLFVADCMRLKSNLRAFHRLEAAMIIVRAVGKVASTPGELLKKTRQVDRCRNPPGAGSVRWSIAGLVRCRRWNDRRNRSPTAEGRVPQDPDGTPGGTGHVDQKAPVTRRRVTPRELNHIAPNGSRISHLGVSKVTPD